MGASFPPLSALERRVVAQLLAGPASAPELAALLGQSDPDVRAALVVLRGRDLVEQAGGAWRVTDRAKAARAVNDSHRQEAFGRAFGVLAMNRAAALLGA